MRRAIVAAFCLLAACSKSPQSPTSPAPSSAPPQLAQYGGFWSGTFRVSICDGDRHCVLIKGAPRPFDLRLQQSGASVRGVFNGNQSVADVSGTVLDDGSLTLTGSDPGAVAGGGSVSAKVELRFSAEGMLQGTLSYHTQPLAQLADFSFPTTYGGDVVSATRTDLQSFAADITGTWKGQFAVRACVPRGRYCHPLRDQEVEIVEMTLSRSGNVVSGACRVGGGPDWIPLSGSVSGSTIRLSGETSAAVSGGTTLSRVSEWTATLDEFGRMKGVFTYESAYPSAAPTLGESASIELWQVIKQ